MFYTFSIIKFDTTILMRMLLYQLPDINIYDINIH